MSDYFERIAGEWGERAGELAAWTDKHMVNRTDVWGPYLAEKYRGESNTGNPKNKAITAPFRQERGKIFLAATSLEKHFKAKDGGGVLGLHSSSSDGTSLWFAIDIDLHDDDDLSVTREGNFVAAKAWWTQLRNLVSIQYFLIPTAKVGTIFSFFWQSLWIRNRYAPLSNVWSAILIDTDWMIPQIFFPGSFGPNHLGSWLRIPGRHHTRKHFSRVWNDEPMAETPWLEGHDAIDVILSIQPASEQTIASNGIEPRVRTVCLDFDGVVHSYQSGWQGEAIIADPPIHGVDRAINQLRKDFRVVIHSARCKTESGRDAIEKWLAKHRIEVDEVCQNKPPAFVYIDDRAIRFTGDWPETIAAIKSFRK